jgi:acetylornithine deacetylase
MASIEERVLQNMDLQDLLATLGDLIAIQSLSGQETPAQEYVAGWLEFQGRYGIIPGEDLAQARQQFEAAVAQAAESDTWLRAHPPVVEWWGGQYATARVPLDEPVVQTLSTAFQAATGTPSRFEGMTYGSDMRLLVNQEHTPAVLFGPGDVRQTHKPDEFVPLYDLLVVTRTLALTALQFCGYIQ